MRSFCCLPPFLQLISPALFRGSATAIRFLYAEPRLAFYVPRAVVTFLVCATLGFAPRFRSLPCLPFCPELLPWLPSLPAVWSCLRTPPAGSLYLPGSAGPAPVRLYCGAHAQLRFTFRCRSGGLRAAHNNRTHCWFTAPFLLLLLITCPSPAYWFCRLVLLRLMPLLRGYQLNLLPLVGFLLPTIFVFIRLTLRLPHYMGTVIASSAAGFPSGSPAVRTTTTGFQLLYTWTLPCGSLPLPTCHPPDVVVTLCRTPCCVALCCPVNLCAQAVLPRRVPLPSGLPVTFLPTDNAAPFNTPLPAPFTTPAVVCFTFG